MHHEPVTFIRAEDNIIVSDTDAAEQLKYITQAIEVFEQYAKSFNIPMRPFNITIDSNLDDANGHKYGIGSSAAVLVSVVKALNEFITYNYLIYTFINSLLSKHEITKFKFLW